MSHGLKKLLFHICCAPDAAVVIERLRSEYTISGFFYNPNIHPQDEYQLRLKELERLTRKMDIPIEPSIYDPDNWVLLTKDMENVPEGGERCRLCFVMRLEKAAQTAVQKGYDIFTTVLSVSPHKNDAMVNEIGLKLEKKYSIQFLNASFKKKDGYKRSLELSKLFHLYRQNYCGCIYSRR